MTQTGCIAMQDYSYSLGEIIKRERVHAGLTQMQVAEALHIDVRTLLNIENHRGNPKFEILLELIRFFKIDANTIFYSEQPDATSAQQKLRLLIGGIAEKDAETLLPVIESVLKALHANDVPAD